MRECQPLNEGMSTFECENVNLQMRECQGILNMKKILNEASLTFRRSRASIEEITFLISKNMKL